MKVALSVNEYKYLINNLLKNNQEFLLKFKHKMRLSQNKNESASFM